MVSDNHTCKVSRLTEMTHCLVNGWMEGGFILQYEGGEEHDS